MLSGHYDPSAMQGEHSSVGLSVGLRHAWAVGVVRETAQRSFELGPVGGKLCIEAPDTVRASVSRVDSQRSWVEAMRTLRAGLPAFDHSHGTAFFDYKQLVARLAFSARIRERSRQLYGQVVELVDWSDGNAVLDIDNGDGFPVSRALGAMPRRQGVLFDPQLVPTRRYRTSDGW